MDKNKRNPMKVDENHQGSPVTPVSEGPWGHGTGEPGALSEGPSEALFRAGYVRCVSLFPGLFDEVDNLLQDRSI
jgi:hypothetical protein